MLVTSAPDGPATHTHSKTHNTVNTISTDPTTILINDKVSTPHTLSEDRKYILRLRQRMDLFCNHIFKGLLSGKASSHKVDIFTHIKGLSTKHVMDSNQRFLALVIPKSRHFTVPIETHDKLGHLIKCQYYWKGMNNDIHKYINNCTLCKREKAKTQVYHLQVTDIPNEPFNKIGIDMVSDLNAPASGNQHILTIMDHLMGWLEAFPIPDKKTDTIVHIFISNYLPINMCPCFILLHNGTESKNKLLFPSNLVLTASFQPYITHKVMENWRFFTDTSNLPLRNSVKRIQASGTNTSTKY